MDMKKKLLFVFNPCSGKAQIKNQLLDIVDTMVKADYEVTIYPTQCAGDAKEKVEAYAGNYDLVVCSGVFQAVSYCINDAQVRLMRNNPVDIILSEIISFRNGNTSVRHIGYGILKYRTTFLIKKVHVIIHCEIRRRTYRTAGLHM